MVSITKSLMLLGGWDGTTTTPPVRTRNRTATIIDGGGSHRGVTVSGAGVSVTIDGLTVDNGFADDAGGGIWVSGADLTLRRTYIHSGRVAAPAAPTLDFGGGGVYFAGGVLMVVSSTFNGNSAFSGSGSAYGGGVFVRRAVRAVFRGCIFQYNDAQYGSAIGMVVDVTAPVAVRDCVFTNNGRGGTGEGTGVSGGALHLKRARATVSGCLFVANEVTSDGAAYSHNEGTVRMDRSSFSGNRAGERSIISLSWVSGSLGNNIIFENQPGTLPSAAAVWVHGEGKEVSLIHNTLVGPDAAERGSGLRASHSAVSLRNNIVARFDEGAVAAEGGDLHIAGTLWGADAWANADDTETDADPGSTITLGRGNIRGDPSFRDRLVAGTGRIGPASAARNAALPTTITVDFDGKRRDSRPDIGADEYSTRVLLLEPDGGQRLREVNIYSIHWTAPARAVAFSISYSTDGGATWRPVADGVATHWYPEWLVPEVPRTKTSCLVRVTGYDSSGAKVGADRSDAPFTILDEE